MKRTQVQLTSEQLAALREVSARTHRSIADLVRESVKIWLEAQRSHNRDDAIERAIAAAGRHRSSYSNTSTDHDAAFAESIASAE